MNTIIGYTLYNIPIYKHILYYYNKKIIHKGKPGTKYENIIYGIKYQCIELVRRFYIHVYNITFDDIDNAIDIFSLKNGINITTNKKIPFIHIYNNGLNIPHLGDIIIWKKTKYIKYGHVAIVNKIISNSIINIAEQCGKNKNIGLRNIYLHNSNIIGWIRI
jgi:hypothetical protein